MLQPRDATSVARQRTRRAVLGSTIGAVIEAYDLLIYGVFAALAFPAIFFPAQSNASGQLLAFTTYFVGFIARPLGGLVFGHFGDRLGRKRMMLVTLTLVAVGTVGGGLLPGYAQVGPLAGYLLVLMRVIQGFGFGGEWGAAVLLAMESGPRRRAGLLGSLPQSGALLGLFLANVSAFVLTVALPRTAFLAWGWRLPFLASGLLILVGFWLRARVAETPEFQRLADSNAIERRPLARLFRRQPGTVVLTALLKSGSSVPIFIFTAFVLAYGVKVGYSPALVTLCVAVSALLGTVVTPLCGALADRIGHERLWQAGAVIMVAFGFGYFALLDSRSAPLAAVAILLSAPVYAVMFGAEPAITGKRFPPAWRYSGSSFAFNVGSILGGGAAPLVSQYLLGTFGTSRAIASYIAISSLVGLAAVTGLRLADRRAASGTPREQLATGQPAPEQLATETA